MLDSSSSRSTLLSATSLRRRPLASRSLTSVTWNGTVKNSVFLLQYPPGHIGSSFGRLISLTRTVLSLQQRSQLL